MRQTLASDLHLFVSPSGSDGNSGTSASSPLKTPQRAIDMASLDYDFAGRSAVVHLAHGTLDAVQLTVAPLGCAGIRIEGDLTDPRACTVSGGAGDCISAAVPGLMLTVAGVKLVSWNGRCLSAYVSARLRIAQSVVFGRATYDHIYANGGEISAAVHPYEIDDGALNHIHSICGANVSVNECVVTVTPTTDVWFTRFVGAAGGSYVGFAGSSFVKNGAVRCSRYLVHKNAVIDTGLATVDQNFLLGDSAGTTTTGGIYV